MLTNKLKISTPTYHINFTCSALLKEKSKEIRKVIKLDTCQPLAETIYFHLNIRPWKNSINRKSMPSFPFTNSHTHFLYSQIGREVPQILESFETLKAFKHQPPKSPRILKDQESSLCSSSNPPSRSSLNGP